MKYVFLRYPGGKSKAVTLSYDDGSNDDKRFAETINEYGLKCTFNIVAARIADNNGLPKEFIKESILAKGHEIANHGYFHRAQDTLRPIEGIRDILDSRLLLEKEFGMIIRGYAYPDRRIDRYAIPVTYEKIKSYLQELDIAYARSLGADNDRFELPEDWLCWLPTSHHKNPHLMEYIDKFLSLDPDSLYISQRGPRLFYLWGHAFEFERDNNWNLLDDICTKLSGRDDIWYATNMEIYNYVTAYRSLVFSADGSVVYNPTLFDIWFDVDKKQYVIKPGETLMI